MDPQQQVRDYLVAHWRSVCVYCGLAIVLLTALLWRLGSLTGGYSTGEVQAYQAGLGFRHILSTPINAPYFLAVRLLSAIYPDHYLITRIVSVSIGIIVLSLFAAVLHMWKGMRTAVIGTLLFGLSSWFLHTARLGTPDVLEFGIFALLAAGYWIKVRKTKTALVLCFFTACIVLYVPGMAWFVLAGIAWQWRTIWTILVKHVWASVIAAAVAAVLLAPLAVALFRHHTLILSYLALPNHIPHLSTLAKNALQVPFHFFVHPAVNPVLWLGTAPILDAFSLAMLCLGSYLYLRHIGLARMQLYSSILVLTLILMILGSPITFSIIIPSVYLAIAGGVDYLLDTWFDVFPRNPIAKSVAWGAMGILIGLVCFYHLTHYFVGWPHAAATQAVFTQVKPD